MKRRHFLIRSLLSATASLPLFEIFRQQSSQALEDEDAGTYKVEIRYRNPSSSSFNISKFYEQIPNWLSQDQFLNVRESFMKTGALLEYHKKLGKKSYSIFYTFRSQQDFSEFVAKCRPHVNRKAQHELNFIEEVIVLS